MTLLSTKAPTLSLQSKIMGVFLASFALLLLVISVMHFQVTGQLHQDLSGAMRLGHTIAENGVMTEQRKLVDKALTSILNTKESGEYLAAPDNKAAGLVLRGLFLTMQADRFGRLAFYNANYQLLLQERDEKLPALEPTLPARFQPLFQKSAKSFENSFYFRRIGGKGPGDGSIEFCGVTVITDSKEQVVGFAEISMAPGVWVEAIAKLTASIGATYDPEGKAFAFSMDPKLYAEIGKSATAAAPQEGNATYQVKGNYFVIDRLPLSNEEGAVEGWLWLGQERTAEIKRDQRRQAISLALIMLVVAVSILGALTIVRRGVIKKVRTVVDALTQSGATILALAGQVAAASNSIADGSSHQAASIEETSASIEETTSMTATTADNAAAAEGLSKDTAGMVAKGYAGMQELQRAMEGIAKASAESMKVVKTIDSIAFQTNLLALNAAVEAARAGEAGAGFAVVADEVRKLAMSAAQSAGETNDLIAVIMNRIGDGQELVRTSAATFAAIVERSNKISGLISEITGACRDQATGASQISLAMNEIDIVTQANVAHAEESAAIATEMESQANTVNQNISQLSTVIGG